MKTIIVDKKKIEIMEDLIKEINKGFKSTSFSIDSVEKRVETLHGHILDIKNDYATKSDVNEVKTDIENLLDNRLTELEDNVTNKFDLLFKHLDIKVEDDTVEASDIEV
ncbi:hypothetical protein [uncultured Aquimarina sp.]|uniref:hypothetical protein n=1 Tax=uncultured Aquimarina sp. TaxID=575652 RepID=UPI002638063D|nr:hypothetical protein [uncultured Aquimarina sp.]